MPLGISSGLSSGCVPGPPVRSESPIHERSRSGVYFTLCTVLWRGRTPGKRIVGERVVKLNGKPMTLVGLVRPVRQLRGWYRHRHGRHGGAEDTWTGDPARSVSFLKQKVHEEIGHDPHSDRDRFVIPRVRGSVEPA